MTPSKFESSMKIFARQMGEVPDWEKVQFTVKGKIAVYGYKPDFPYFLSVDSPRREEFRSQNTFFFCWELGRNYFMRKSEKKVNYNMLT